MRRTWLIIREVSTDEIRISSLPAGERPEADARYRCHGPFRSRVAAQLALDERSSVCRAVLYGEGCQYVRDATCWRCQSVVGRPRPRGPSDSIYCDECYGILRKHEEDAAAGRAVPRVSDIGKVGG